MKSTEHEAPTVAVEPAVRGDNMNDSDICVGDKVETAVFVCGERVPMRTGVVTAVHSGYCEVDVASLHGCAPWIFREQTSHLRKLTSNLG